MYQNCTPWNLPFQFVAIAGGRLLAGREIRNPNATLAGRWHMTFRDIEVLWRIRPRDGTPVGGTTTQ